jgi:hypothetical protein
LIKVILIFILSVLALILVVVSAGFFISSLYLVFHKIFHQGEIAAALSGASMLILALLLLIVIAFIKSSLLKFKAAPKLQQKIENISKNPAEETLNLVKAHPFSSAFTALASGFILGFFPKLRDNLIDGVSTYMKTGSIPDSLKAFKTNPDENEDNDN